MPLLALLAQSAIFVFGVYLQKFLRKQFCSRQQGKKIKQTTRILICGIVTALILLFNYQHLCAPMGIGYRDCFYINIQLDQVLHVIVANSLLFAAHIYYKFISCKVDWSRYSLKGVVFAPMLEQLLFRASFARTAAGQIPSWILALLFSVSHLHKGIRKWIKGKQPNWNGSVSQVVFTFVFGCYSFYFLNVWKSVIPSIILHCYCNVLGPPMINKQNLYYHLASIGAMIGYCYLFI